MSLRAITTLGLTLIAFGVACRKAPPAENQQTIKDYGLLESDRGREEVSKGIALANGALLKSVGLRLHASWQSARTHDQDEIPVFLVAGAGLSRSDRVFVPDRERIILVNADSLQELPFIFHETGHDYTNSTFKVGIERYLGLMFLHELGHIYLRHSGSRSALPEHLDPELNLKENSGKETELAADKFAADQIRATDMFETMQLRLALTDIVWNFNAWRALQHFGSDQLFVPEVYWDHGTSHPNLAFRMLVIADLVNSSEVSREMLKRFVEGRDRRPWNKVLVSITDLETMLKVVGAMGYKATLEEMPDRTRFHLFYPPTGAKSFVDVWPGKVEAGIREIARATGVNLTQ